MSLSLLLGRETPEPLQVSLITKEKFHSSEATKNEVLTEVVLKQIGILTEFDTSKIIELLKPIVQGLLWSYHFIFWQSLFLTHLNPFPAYTGPIFHHCTRE